MIIKINPSNDNTINQAEETAAIEPEQVLITNVLDHCSDDQQTVQRFNAVEIQTAITGLIILS